MRRPIDPIMQNKLRRRHLINRRDTLIMGILQASKQGDEDRANIIRAEVMNVNNILSAVESEYKSMTK